MVDFWCRSFSWFTQSFSRFIRDVNGEKKHLVIWWSFSRLVFHSLPPLDKRVLFFTIPFVNVRGNVVRTFLGKSDFHCLAETVAMLSVCQCPLCPEFCSYYVPTFFCKQTDYKPTGPAFPERDILMSRDKHCRETIFVSPSSRNFRHHWGHFERGKKGPLLWGRDSLGGILGDNLGEGNCESKIVSRQWGDNLAPRHVSQGPLGRCSCVLLPHLLCENFRANF